LHINEKETNFARNTLRKWFAERIASNYVFHVVWQNICMELPIGWSLKYSYVHSDW